MDLSGIFFSVWFQLTCFSLEQPAGARFHHVRDHGGQTKNIRNAHLDSNSRWWLQTIPSGYVKMAIENGHRNSLFTHKKWWLSIVMLVYQRVYGISMENPPQNGLVDWFESYESARNVDRFLSPSGFSDFTVGEGFRHASTVGLAECLDPHFAMPNGSMISMSHSFFRRTHVELPFIMYYVTWIHLRHYDNDNTWITLQPTHPCIVIKKMLWWWWL